MKKNQYLYLVAAIIIAPILCKEKSVTLFSHGIAAKGKQQARTYLKSYVSDDIIHYNKQHTINSHYVSFNYPDATDRFYRVNYNETSFGQENEIARLYKAYGKTLEWFENMDIILYGVSRGASNLLIFAGTHTVNNVKAMVLESPYLTISEVIANILQKKNVDTLISLSWGETVAEFIFKKYTRYGYSPANCIENIPQDMPIFIICSENDHLVPCFSSINVYKKLVKSGNKNVYIFIAQQGKHGAILQGPEGEKYQHVINAFYKKYNLSYNPSDAEKGELLLPLCQPVFD